MKGYYTGKPIPKEPFERSSYLFDHAICTYRDCAHGDFFVWKDKYHNISGVESLRNEAIRIRKKISDEWDILYETCEKLVHIQGNLKGVIYYLKANDGGISTSTYDKKTVKEDSISMTLAKDEDLPLYVGKEHTLSAVALKIFKDRLKGPKSSGNKNAVECPVRADLIKKYIYLSNRFKTVRKVVYHCDKILLSYIENKYSHFYVDYRYNTAFIKLILNGRNYLVYFNANEFKIVSCPESTIIEDTGPVGEYLPKKMPTYRHEVDESDNLNIEDLCNAK